jgi:glycosyltransferase involved in cell wall biosynthesis
MESFSVIVTAHNMESVIGRTLASVEAAIAKLANQRREPATDAAEIVVVEDGSKDGTWRSIQEQAAGKDSYKLVRLS